MPEADSHLSQSSVDNHLLIVSNNHRSNSLKLLRTTFPDGYNHRGIFFLLLLTLRFITPSNTQILNREWLTVQNLTALRASTAARIER
jgi:hypothetical protein